MRGLPRRTSSTTPRRPPMTRDSVRTSGNETVLPVRVHARRAAATLSILVVIAPTALCGQGLDHSAAVLPGGPFETAGRAGVGALAFPPAAPAPSMSVATLVVRDTSSHHGSRAHHVAVGALIGGAVGLVLGIAGDRPGLGRGEMRGGHFHNLWLLTVPLGAGMGALVGLVPRTD